MPVSQRSAIEPFQVMRVQQRVTLRREAGLPVYALHVGQPSTQAPAPVRAAAHALLDTDRIAYTDGLGVLQLREAVAGHYARTYGIDVDPGNVGITTGSSAAFQYAFLAAFEAGDAVAVTRPGYPAYRNTLQALGCRLVDIPIGPETAYRLTVDHLDALPEPPAGLVLAGPANPTGTTLHQGELEAVVGWCAAHGTRLISDEIYHGISFGGPCATAWQFDRSAVVVNSFSKYFSMTGWRIGWMLLPDDLHDPVDRLAGNLALCPPTLSQLAAVAAFEAYDELDANVARYADNRRALMEALPAIGIDSFAPADGAFYIYADVSRWTTDSLSWCARLLDETGVALAPGVDFDPVDGAEHIRICFAGAGDELMRAVQLLGGWLARSGG